MTRMKRGIQPAELGFFATLARSGSLSAAARELGISTAGREQAADADGSARWACRWSIAPRAA